MKQIGMIAIYSCNTLGMITLAICHFGYGYNIPDIYLGILFWLAISYTLKDIVEKVYNITFPEGG